MKVSIIQMCKYSPDKVSIVTLYPGDVVELPDNIAEAFIGHGYCVQKNNESKKVNNFNPVEETAVIDPVEEVKEKPKRKKRRKKAE